MSNYTIINVKDLPSVDISNCKDTSVDTVRRSVDGTKCVLEYEGAMPSDIAALNSSEYDEVEILDIMSGTDWTEVTDDDII